MSSFVVYSVRLVGSARVDRRAFTLVELLTVVAIIGILAAILIPVVSSIRATAQMSTCASNLRQITMATLLLTNEDRGRFPGTGVVPGAASASWADVMNHLAFSKTSLGGQGLVQRLGQTQIPGSIYCPSMEAWGATSRAPRAYTRNSFVSTTTNVGTVNGIENYRLGLELNRFDDLSRRILFLESEDSRDTCRGTAPLNTVGLGNDGAMPPWSGNSGAFAFRHRNQMNVAFMDGHVALYSPDTFGPLNNDLYFRPR